MNLTITIDSVDKTSMIPIESIRKEDNLNNRVDIFSFVILKNTTDAYEPEVNDEVIMTIDGTKEFGGVLLSLEKEIVDFSLVKYTIRCSDYSQYLDRKLVLERYDDETVDDIIANLVSVYATDFTVVNVDCDVELETMVFNRINMSDCLDRLAKATGYSWYVDYNKDIHFFDKNKNSAPFNLTDSNGNFLQNSLKIKNDLSQIRNKVYVRGADERGSSRTETYEVLDDKLEYSLANKFAEKPTVTVNSVAQTVGVDFLNDPADYDCLWNFSEKYIKFPSALTIGHDVEITGIPLFPVIVAVQDSASISDYGFYEFYVEEKSITSRTEAREFASTQIASYKTGVIEGSFDTDQAGLRSGQIININSTTLNVNENFLIQRVSFNLKGKNKGNWKIDLASLRTIGILDVLQELLRQDGQADDVDNEGLISYYMFTDGLKITDTVGTPSVTSPPYKWSNDIETTPNKLVWNFGTWS